MNPAGRTRSVKFFGNFDIADTQKHDSQDDHQDLYPEPAATWRKAEKL